jgi:hypothetical protein
MAISLLMPAARYSLSLSLSLSYGYAPLDACRMLPALDSIRQHTSSYVSMLTAGARWYVRARMCVCAYVSVARHLQQHTSNIFVSVMCVCVCVRARGVLASGGCDEGADVGRDVEKRPWHRLYIYMYQVYPHLAVSAYLRTNEIHALQEAAGHRARRICTHMYTCIYILNYMHTHTYIHVYIHPYIRIYIYTYIHTCIHIYIHIHIHIYICTHTHTLTSYIHHTYIYIHTHTHIYKHTHTHTHTHTHSVLGRLC